MRIAIWHNLPSGGGKRALFHQVRGLLNRGHHVEVWSPPSAESSLPSLKALVREHVVPVGARGAIEGRSPYGKIAGRIRRLDAHGRRCAVEMESRGFEVLLSGSCRWLRAPSIARHTGIPSLLYLQEPYRWFYESLPDLPWRALASPPRPSLRHAWARLRDASRVRGYRVQAREEWLGARAFHRILVNSTFSRESVLRAYGLESTVCRLGVDARLFQPRPLAREGFVVSLGDLVFGKGADRVIRALATVEESVRPPLVWIGNMAMPGYQDEVEALARQEGVRLQLRIGIADDELIDWLSRASAMVYAPRLEPLGLAPLEAGACELPVAALAEGGVRETIRHGVNGLLAESPEPAALGAAVRELVTRPGLARQLGKQARQHVIEHWSWERACEDLERALLESCPPGSGSRALRPARQTPGFRPSPS